MLARVEEHKQVSDAAVLEDAPRRSGWADDHERPFLAPEDRARVHEHAHSSGVEELHVAEIDDECSLTFAHRIVEGGRELRGCVDVYLPADEHAGRA